MNILLHVGSLTVVRDIPSRTPYDHTRGCVSLKEKQLIFVNLVKSQGLEINIKSYWIALKFDMRLRSSTAEPPVKFQSK